MQVWLGAAFAQLQPPSLQPVRAAPADGGALQDAAPLGSAPRNMALRAMFRYAVEDAASQQEERAAMHDSVSNIIKHALQNEIGGETGAPSVSSSWVHGFYSPLARMAPLPLGNLPDARLRTPQSVGLQNAQGAPTPRA